jgi:hypothetical protein
VAFGCQVDSNGRTEVGVVINQQDRLRDSGSHSGLIRKQRATPPARPESRPEPTSSQDSGSARNRPQSAIAATHGIVSTP